VARNEVPLVDLTGWYSGGPDGRRKVAGQVDAALRDVGFLLVSGHRVPPELTAAVRAAARAFFALPEPVKAAYTVAVGGRGFLPFGVEANGAAYGLDTPPDLKESFTAGRDADPGRPGHEGWYAPNVWPAELPALRDLAERYMRACRELADDLLEICALALDLPSDFFTSRCDHAPYSLNLNWYPPLRRIQAVGEGQFRIGPHTDFGTLTVLDRQPGLGGLQVRAVDGEWADAPYVPGALTINTGDLLARWTGDRWRSTPHRVLPPDPRAPAEDLVSLIFFYEANPWTVVETLPGTAAGPVRYPPVGAGEYLRSRLDAITVT